MHSEIPLVVSWEQKELTPGRKVSLLPRRWKNSVDQNFLIVSKLHGKIDFIPRLGDTRNYEKQLLTITTLDMAHLLLRRT